MNTEIGRKRVPAVMRPMVPSQELQKFVGDRALPRAEVLKSLSQYVKKHELQDPSNRRIVHCDERLRSLFGVDKCTILEMSKYISPHLDKPEVVGGKYVVEAEQLEEQYLANLVEKAADKSEASKSKKRGKALRKQLASMDKEQGRRLFKPVILSPELSAICRGKKEMPRPDILKAVWDYIRLNNLNSTQGEPIKCDFLLQKVFGVDRISSTDIMKGISKHVTKKE